MPSLTIITPPSASKYVDNLRPYEYHSAPYILVSCKTLPHDTVQTTNNISEIRKEKHLSQDDLAVALGVCRKSIFNIEHNNVIPNIDTCLRLAKYLDMTVEDLFEIQDA